MSAALTVDILAPDALDAGLVARWRALVASNPALTSPYFMPEFTLRGGPAVPGAAVAVLQRGGAVTGIFPHQRRGAAVLPLGAPMNDYHGVIAAPGEAPSLHALARLLRTPRLSVGGWVGPAEGGLQRTTVQAALPEGFDAWYGERRATFGKYFKDKERARRSLEAELGPIRVEVGVRDADRLDELIQLKRDQYRRTGRHDVFACGWTRDLLHALMTPAGAGEDPRFGVSLGMLWAGERLAAIEASLHGGEEYHFWFPAYDPRWARCSPGILLSMDTMRLASADGWRTFDYGFAGEGYKKYFCNAERTVVEAVVARPGVASALGAAAAGALELTGRGRGARLLDSVRRRWAAIEACETSATARVRGVAGAAKAAAVRLQSSAIASART
jgi:CelD/BcsL family acetyltransferase involved in cellulose biosynthesis